jgi:hypothetical protein
MTFCPDTSGIEGWVYPESHPIPTPTMNPAMMKALHTFGMFFYTLFLICLSDPALVSSYAVIQYTVNQFMI